MSELTCSVQVPSPCANPAVTVLHKREYPWSDWTEHPRCAEHPAEAFIPVITRAFPMAETRIEKL